MSKNTAFDPDVLPALRNLVLNGYRVINPEGFDVSAAVIEAAEVDYP